MSLLFQPWDLGGLRLSNRIVIAPMCQYSAQDGVPGDWHMVHLGHLAHSGAGLFILEATAVTPDGRITPWDLGLYNDEQEHALGGILEALRKQAPISWGMQLAHAGRKASSQAPWRGGAQIPLSDPLALACGRRAGCQCGRASPVLALTAPRASAPVSQLELWCALSAGRYAAPP